MPDLRVEKLIVAGANIEPRGATLPRSTLEWWAQNLIKTIEDAGLILSLPPAPGQHSPACAHPHGNTCHPACPTCHGTEILHV
jgi:hypothetical protein